MSSTRRRLNPALVISVIALVLALGGTAVAAKRYLITNTKQISPKVLKEIAAAAAGRQGQNGSPGPAGAAGSPGATGVAGAAGHEGPRSDIIWAVVEPKDAAAPEVKASEEGVTVEEEDIGTYAVAFKRNVTDCAYEATIGLAGEVGTAFPGFVTVVRQFGQADSVFVQTFDKEGDRSEHEGFHLAVFC
jgi:hypothetical protein